MEKLTDTSLMPFGKHRGKPMIDVPADYLIYVYESYPLEIRGGAEVRDYISDNLEVLRHEVNERNKKRFK